LFYTDLICLLFGRTVQLGAGTRSRVVKTSHAGNSVFLLNKFVLLFPQKSKLPLLIEIFDRFNHLIWTEILVVAFFSMLSCISSQAIKCESTLPLAILGPPLWSTEPEQNPVGVDMVVMED
jgi:hypothetical protein